MQQIKPAHMAFGCTIYHTPIIRFIIAHFSLSLFFYSFMCTILFLFVCYSILFTSCPYFVYCVFVYFVYSSIQPLAVILQ